MEACTRLTSGTDVFVRAVAMPKGTPLMHRSDCTNTHLPLGHAMESDGLGAERGRTTYCRVRNECARVLSTDCKPLPLRTFQTALRYRWIQFATAATAHWAAMKTSTKLIMPSLCGLQQSRTLGTRGRGENRQKKQSKGGPQCKWQQRQRLWQLHICYIRIYVDN